MQSVPVLILVLCCMASAHRAIHNMAIRHIEARQSQDCSITNIPTSCVEAVGKLNTNDADILSAALDVICGDRCVGPLDDYYECLSGYERYVEYICERQDGQYCLVTTADLLNTCDGDGCPFETCSDSCYSCVSRYVDDLSCCVDQYRKYSFVHISAIEEDSCGNHYGACSGGAIAVPTVLTALLLMVMTAIVMWRTLTIVVIACTVVLF